MDGRGVLLTYKMVLMLEEVVLFVVCVFGCFFVGKYLMGKNGNVCQRISEYRHIENKCRCVLVCMLACMHAGMYTVNNDTIMHALKHQQIDVTQVSIIFLELHEK